MGEASVNLRPAVAADVPEMLRVRAAVQENRLVSRVIGPEEAQEAIERTGRGWVAEVDSQMAGFAIGNFDNGNIWALFMDPPFEGRGLARRLHDTMVNAMLDHGLPRLHLSTDPGTRAERFYRRAGWRDVGPAPGGEVAFEWIATEAPRAPRPELPIRMITEADADSFRACLDTVAREKRYLAQTEALPLARIQGFVKDSVAQDAVQFVAVDGARVVGWADIFPGWAHAVMHTGTLGMGVHPDYRGRGLGRRLLQACIDKAWRKGITRITLEARADNRPAITLYESLGFAHEALKPRALRFDGAYFDAVQMRLLKDA
jgi:GNAT superfamily N-acetyltransferase